MQIGEWPPRTEEPLVMLAMVERVVDVTYVDKDVAIVIDKDRGIH